MKNQLKWRLGKLPTSEEVLSLVKDQIITKDEAREILFNEVTPDSPDVESLKQEVKFLRETISMLAKRSTVVDTIKLVQPYYGGYQWFTPYYTYCSTSGASVTLTGGSSTSDSSWTGISTASGITNAVYTSGSGTQTLGALTASNYSQGDDDALDFKLISTF